MPNTYSLRKDDTGAQYLIIKEEKDASWRDEAACKDMGPEMFYPERGESTKERREMRKELCGNCPVKEPCLEYGLFDDHGVWGGTTPRERKKLRKGRTNDRALVKHGSAQGYDWHIRTGEPPCPWCKAAVRENGIRERGYTDGISA